MKKKYLHQNILLNSIDDITSIYNIYYQQLGCYAFASDHFVERNAPDFFMLQICTAGRGVYKCGNIEYIIKPGDVFFCYPNIYTSYASSIEEPWTVYWVHFYGDIVWTLLQQYNISYRNAIFNIPNTIAYTAIFDNILEYNPDENKNILMICQSLFNQLLFMILNASTKEYCINETIYKAVKYINNNLDKKISATEVCNYVNTSKFYFSHLFKKQIGISPNKYIINGKINNAKMLLLNTSKSITEISMLVGFDNCMYFSNVFKKHIGVSPNTFRHLNNK